MRSEEPAVVSDVEEELLVSEAAALSFDSDEAADDSVADDSVADDSAADVSVSVSLVVSSVVVSLVAVVLSVAGVKTSF